MLEWLTGILAIATCLLAWATWKMAKSTKLLAQIEAEPQFALKDIELNGGIDPARPAHAFVNVELVFSNPGKVLVQYRTDSLDASIDGNEVVAGAEFKNRGGAAHPGNTTKFMYPSIFVPLPVKNPVNGQIALNISFWSRDGQKRSMRQTLDLQIHGVGSGALQWRWFNTSGPVFG